MVTQDSIIQTITHQKIEIKGERDGERERKRDHNF